MEIFARFDGRTWFLSDDITSQAAASCDLWMRSSRRHHGISRLFTVLISTHRPSTWSSKTNPLWSCRLVFRRRAAFMTGLASWTNETARTPHSAFALKKLSEWIDSNLFTWKCKMNAPVNWVIRSSELIACCCRRFSVYIVSRLTMHAQLKRKHP